MSDIEQSCRLWTWRNGRVWPVMFSSEAAAAANAYMTEIDGTGSTDGVEFPDGRYIRAEDWNAYNDLWDDGTTAEVREFWKDRPQPPEVGQRKQEPIPPRDPDERVTSCAVLFGTWLGLGWSIEPCERGLSVAWFG